MNKNIHKEILKVCRKAWVTFGKVTSAVYCNLINIFNTPVSDTD